jgi:hypothetical protein
MPVVQIARHSAVVRSARHTMTPNPTPVRFEELERSLRQARAIATLLEEISVVHAQVERDLDTGEVDEAKRHIGVAERLRVAAMTLNIDLRSQREDYLTRVRSGATIVASLIACFAF